MSLDGSQAIVKNTTFKGKKAVLKRSKHFDYTIELEIDVLMSCMLIPQISMHFPKVLAGKTHKSGKDFGKN
jgi:hypothetical protein